MNEQSKNSIHWSFWAIGAIALVWNVMGTINYLGQLNPEFVASMPETHRALVEGRPVWATAGFAVGVFGGALGCLLLLFRTSAAFYVLIASLLGVVVTMIHTFRVQGGSEVDFTAFEMLLMVLMPLVVAVFLVGYSKRVESKGWLR